MTPAVTVICIPATSSLSPFSIIGASDNQYYYYYYYHDYNDRHFHDYRMLSPISISDEITIAKEITMFSLLPITTTDAYYVNYHHRYLLSVKHYPHYQ